MTGKPHDHTKFTQSHIFLGHGHAQAEKRARLVTALTALFMGVEIAVGLLSGSMALLADGVHMATHAGALGLAALTYWLARRHASDARFSFGSGKFGDLAAFANAIVLGVLALGVAAESIRRFFEPLGVAYREALIVASLGLAVNLISAVLLHDKHEHDDHNLRAAYMHVVADALTSVLAIVALAAGLVWGASWADPLVGVIGAVMIASWSYGLMADSARVLLDAEDDPELARDIKDVVEHEFAASVSDLHLWRLGPGHRGLILSVVGAHGADCVRIKEVLRERHPSLSHITVESTVCEECT